MGNKDIALMAHLMRRAGFGASYEELEARAAKGYEATVEELLDPDAHGIPTVDLHYVPPLPSFGRGGGKHRKKLPDLHLLPPNHSASLGGKDDSPVAHDLCHRQR